MTDTPTTDATEGELPPDAPEPDGEPAEGDDEVSRLRSEAARRRVEARDATERADRLHARLVDQAVATATDGLMADGAEDFARFHDGPVPLDDDGFPDVEAIRSAAEAIIEARPHLAARRFSPIAAGPQGDDAPAPSTILGALRGTV